MSLIPALRDRSRQADLCEFKDSLVYTLSSRIARTVTQRSAVLKVKTKQTNKKKTQQKQKKQNAKHPPKPNMQAEHITQCVCPPF